MAEKYELEALIALQNEPPRYVVDSAVYEAGNPKAGDLTGQVQFDNYYSVRIKAWVDENYDYVGRFYYADLYRLKPLDDTDG